MSTILFPSPVFGPVHSRRLGISLGVNLMPADGKLCSFDCIYCECGLNAERPSRSKVPRREEVRLSLEEKLRAMSGEGRLPDNITFAGNGEPTGHPEFEAIVGDVIALRDAYAPRALVSVLTNAARIGRPDVFRALMRVDNPLLKLDTADRDFIELVNRPNARYDLEETLRCMRAMGSHAVIQTMFLRGTHEGKSVDNTTDGYVLPWLEAVRSIGPKLVTIYTIDRETPENTLKKAEPAVLDAIAEKIRRAGLQVTVSY